jgi:cell division protein FtsN
MYFNLITEVTGRKEELKLYEQMLQEKFKQMSQPESDNKLEQLTDLQTQMLHQMTLQQKQQQLQQGPYPESMGSLLICISKMAVSSSQKFLQRFPKEIFCSHIQKLRVLSS